MSFPALLLPVGWISCTHFYYMRIIRRGSEYEYELEEIKNYLSFACEMDNEIEMRE